MPADLSAGEGGAPVKGHTADPLGVGGAQQVDIVPTIGSVFNPRRVESPLDRLTRQAAGKRSFTRTSRKRGRYVQARPAHGDLSDVALDATLRQAALHQAERGAEAGTLALTTDDVQRKVRVRRAGNLILFVVDASWSMAGAQRMEATKGAIMSLLVDAYQKRDRVGLVVFQKEEARLVLALYRQRRAGPAGAAPPAGRRQDPAVGRAAARLPRLSPRDAPGPRGDAAADPADRRRRQRGAHRSAASGRGARGGRPDPHGRGSTRW